MGKKLNTHIQIKSLSVKANLRIGKNYELAE